MNQTLLEIKNLNIDFIVAEKFTGMRGCAVKDLNLSIPEASFVSLVGESGSGKSVTALAMTRLLRSARISGSIQWLDKDARHIDLLTLREKHLLKYRGDQIAYVFQDAATCLNPVLRVGEQVEEAYLAHQEGTREDAQKRTREMFQLVRLGDASHVYRSFPHELSGGMKQRVLIAMALISNPRLIIADEPTTALDVVTEFEILSLLATLQKEKNLSIFFITHDLNLAARYSEKIHVLEKGNLVETLEKKEGGFKPKEIYTKNLFAAQLHHTEPKNQISLLGGERA